MGTYTYNASGANSTRPHAVTKTGTGATAVTYRYDANDNLTAGGGRTLTWDAENRPTQIVQAGVTTRFVYDGDGGRVKKTVSTAQNATVYIGQLYVCQGTACAKLIYAGRQRVAMVQVGSGATSYFHGDHLGSTSVLTEASGTEEERNSYRPYGALQTHTGTADVAYKYTGQERDASTALYFYQARYYAQGLGRFVSPDSLVPDALDPQAFNRYAYARNNPVRYTDPTGHSWFDDWPPGDWNPVPEVPETVPMLSEHVVTAPPWGFAPYDLGPWAEPLGLDPWAGQQFFGSDPVVTLVGGVGDSGNYISKVSEITISNDRLLSFSVETTAPEDSSLSVWLERAFLKMDTSGNNAKDFRFRLFGSLAAKVEKGVAFFQTSIYGMQPGYLRIIPQYFPRTDHPPVLTNFSACGGFANSCLDPDLPLGYTDRWTYPY